MVREKPILPLFTYEHVFEYKLKIMKAAVLIGCE